MTDLETRLHQALQRLDTLEAELRTERARRTSQRKWLGVAAAVTLVGVGAFTSRVAFAQAACTFPGLPAALIPMCADTPARADDVNQNNVTLVNWLQQKVGPVGSAAVTLQGTVDFGSQLTQAITTSGGTAGFGFQTNGVYQRSPGNFAWYVGGAHASPALDSGGGTSLMTLNSSGLTVNALARLNQGVSTTNILASGGVSGSNLAATGNVWDQGPTDQVSFAAGGSCPGTGQSQCPSGQFVCGIRYVNQCGNNWFDARWTIQCCGL